MTTDRAPAAANSHRPFRVLFICTHNSARSIMAEAILNKVGKGLFEVFSAGSRPRGSIDPHARTLLEGLGYDVSGFRSKSWDEFAGPGMPEFDFIFTVCDDAAGESCPVWPGHPDTAHWGVEDPSKATGNAAEVSLAYDEAYRVLKARIDVFVALPIDKLDRQALLQHLRTIGKLDGAAEQARA